MWCIISTINYVNETEAATEAAVADADDSILTGVDTVACELKLIHYKASGRNSKIIFNNNALSSLNSNTLFFG